MKLLYNIFIALLRLGYKVASLLSNKAKKFYKGRKRLFSLLKKAMESNNAPVVWFHCASLGEFEQGRPIIEQIKKEYPNLKILLTFFSSSGYEVRKNYPGADFIFYLPWDTKKNAKRFIQIAKPVLAVFIKYEFWYHFTRQLKKQDVPLLSVSTIFRPDQIYFKRHRSFFRNILKTFTWFFVQNDESENLLKSINIQTVTRTGDTRFDRVYQQSQAAEEIPLAKQFKNNSKLMVIGSSWPEDMRALTPFINEQHDKLKFIIAPHEISDSSIQKIQQDLHVRSFKYSAPPDHPENFDVMIIDNVGMLSRLYRYGEFAYVGGAFGKGLHNILEAACYGVPIFFGNKAYKKFQEAKDLINLGGAFPVADYNDLKSKYEAITDPQNFLLACNVTHTYVKENLGATEKIMQFCRHILTAP